jgi:cytochrome P450
MYHPLNPSDAQDPFEALADLRRHCPVPIVTHPVHPPLAVVTRLEDASTVYRKCPAAGGVRVSGREEADREVLGGQLLRLTGSKHAAVRRIVMAAVIPRAVTAAEPGIESMCRAVVESIPSSSPVDLAETWASTIPSRAIGRLLGFPDEDHQTFYRWTQVFIEYVSHAARGEVSSTIDAGMRSAVDEFQEYVSGHVARRRGDDAPDDAITRMMRAEHGDVRLTDAELVSNVIFLLMAGNQTTQSLLTNTILHLVTSESYELVRTERDLLTAAIEESLRVAPPIQYVVRVPDVDVRIGPVIIPAGQPIAISNLSANRDESAWGADAGVFDLHREQQHNHLAFASGPHSCIGAALARAVGYHAIDALMDRYASFELAPGFEWERRDLWTSWGGKRLDVVPTEDLPARPHLSVAAGV